MAKVFDAKMMAKLDDPRRKDIMPAEKVLSILEVKAGERILDLGCGIGYLAIPAARLVGPEGFVFGLDIQEAMLAEALSRSQSQGLRQVAWVLSAPDYITLPTASVNGIAMLMVAHEIPDLGKTLIECKRVLQPGGRIGIVEWNDTYTQMGPPLEHRLKSDDLLQKMSLNGFRESCVVELSEATYMVLGVL